MTASNCKRFGQGIQGRNKNIPLFKAGVKISSENDLGSMAVQFKKGHFTPGVAMKVPKERLNDLIEREIIYELLPTAVYDEAKINILP